SRRRHTRSDRDWSSDVCSSDLYSQLLSERLRQHGVADAVATLDKLAATDADVAEHAHEFAHGLGIEAYGRSTDIVATFAACGDGFSSGCRHGVIQAYRSEERRGGQEGGPGYAP